MTKAHSQSPNLTQFSNAAQWGLPKWFLPVFRGMLIEVFILIAIGAAVRVMNAGLACPDWPLCFGDFIPDYHPQVFLEFIHRAMAGMIAIAMAVLSYFILFRSKAPKSFKVLTIFACALLLTQVIFGGLTVILKLQSYVVATHLTMGTGFFAILTWMYMSLRKSAKDEVPSSPMMKFSSRIMLAGIFGQIILGGLVASHYAALVCTDFPTCHGQWFPTFRGIIGLHVIHRLGAYTVMALALWNWWILSKSESARVRKLGMWICVLVFIQAGIGIANVLLLTPPLIAVMHLAVATGILGLSVRAAHAQS